MQYSIVQYRSAPYIIQHTCRAHSAGVRQLDIGVVEHLPRTRLWSCERIVQRWSDHLTRRRLRTALKQQNSSTVTRPSVNCTQHSSSKTAAQSLGPLSTAHSTHAVQQQYSHSTLCQLHTALKQHNSSTVTWPSVNCTQHSRSTTAVQSLGPLSTAHSTRAAYTEPR